ncbi:molybdopterin-dependent oxidoreductase [Maricurvus nonylphenolicus]|uniref:molybdopterin-dependent oxidoreductase n=1 Tax=Maricurvus nonylphenolicus TaxID=1008307 RepID=UPI0036F371D4
MGSKLGKMDRRQFVKWGSAVSAGMVASNNSWGLSSLKPMEPLTDTLSKDYPYRGWEDIYRQEYEYDSVGYAAHCVNCHGNCAFKVLVKDGIVVREEQLAQYPQIDSRIPDTNPRGCQKGAIHSQAMYEPDRLRYPMKRVGERGESKWQRISWDQAATEIADKILDIHEQYGPGKILTHTGTGALSGARLAAGVRFAALLGGVIEDQMTDVGDGQSGQTLATGDCLQNFTSDAWFDADYIINSFHNPVMTRIPDAHYMTEAKYNGCRVVSVSPDYNPTAIRSDLWININPGADPFMYMAMVQVILAENLWDAAFVKEKTDLTLLVRNDNDKLLRQSDLQADGKADVFYMWDQASGKAVTAPGSMGSDVKSLSLNGIDPALEGEFEVDGIAVKPAFVHMRAEANNYTPESTEEKTGVHPSIVRDEARRFAKAKKAFVVSGFASAKMLNGIYIQWAQVLMCSLTGHLGERGGYFSPYSMLSQEGVFGLCFPKGKMPRFECGGLGEYVHGRKIDDARKHYNSDKLKQRAGFTIDELDEIIRHSIESRQMPVYEGIKAGILTADNKFVRNKGPEYRERMLKLFEELLVVIDIRLNSTAQFADYVLPAAAHYEAWDVRTTPLHRHANLFTAPAKPVGESKSDWNIKGLILQKLQQRAQERNFQAFEDGPIKRDFTTIYDEYTLQGTVTDDKAATRWIIEHTPGFKPGDFERGVEQGFLVVNNSPLQADCKIEPNKPIHSWRAQDEDNKPFPTLSGRLTFYCDHELFQRLDSCVPTARWNSGPEASDYPYTFYTPHTRWAIHSSWRSNKYMQRLQRGEPFVYVSPKLAAEKGIVDGGQVRVFNGLGEFQAQAKLMPGIRDNQVMMEHAWERHQFKGGQGLNSVVATLIQPLETVGNWGHLKFELYKWNPNSLANETGVDIEAVQA